MITIGKLSNKCTTLQGLKYGAISQNNYNANVNLNIDNIQDNLDSFEYNRTLKNDDCFGLMFESLEIPKSHSNIDLNINNIQSNLDSFEYDRTINNDISFALKFKSLENPKVNFILNTKMYRFVPYKTYSSTIKITKKYESMIKG